MNNKIDSKFLLGLLVGIIIGIILGIIASSYLLLINNKSRQSSNSSSSLNNIQEQKVISEIREKEHIIEGTNLKFVPKENLIILTESEKQSKQDIINYEFVATNAETTRSVFCFIDENEKITDDFTSKQYIEQAIEEGRRTDITTVIIAGTEFQKVSLVDDAENKYTVDFYVSKIDNKMLCFNYWYLKGEVGNLADMITIVSQD